MIKKLIPIVLFTGVGHLLALISLKLLTKNVGQNEIAFIGEIDAITILILTIISFGLQLATTRDLAILDDWKAEYKSTQSARLMLSLLLIFIGFSGFYITKNLLYFIAPVFALNADYALYGRSKPIKGSIVALIRIAIPSLTLIISSFFFQETIIILYTLSILVSYFLTGVLVSRILKVPYFIKPKLKNLNKYYKNLNIGIAGISLYFVGIGIISVMPYFNSVNTIAVSYVALKLYMIFKGVNRIIIQTFFKELLSLEVSIKVDFLSSVVGLYFLNCVWFFPKITIPLLFDTSYIFYSITFIILGVSSVISSFTSSAGTRLLLQKKDKEYTIINVIAALITIISAILLFYTFGDKPYLIVFSVLLGELATSVLSVIILNEKGYVLKRITIILPIIVIMVAIYLLKMSFGQTTIVFIGSSVFFFGCSFLTQKLFNIID